jgi:hypothetical protein
VRVHPWLYFPPLYLPATLRETATCLCLPTSLPSGYHTICESATCSFAPSSPFPLSYNPVRVHISHFSSSPRSHCPRICDIVPTSLSFLWVFPSVFQSLCVTYPFPCSSPSPGSLALRFSHRPVCPGTSLFVSDSTR